MNIGLLQRFVLVLIRVKTYGEWNNSRYQYIVAIQLLQFHIYVACNSLSRARPSAGAYYTGDEERAVR